MSFKSIDIKQTMLGYSIPRIANIPEYQKLCEAVCVGKNSILNAINYLSDTKNIDKAEGVWLDYIGWLVGTRRDYTDISQFFCVNAEDVNVEKYFWFGEQTIGTNVSLTDALFRRQIYGKIGYNTSKCTRNENIRNIKNMTFAEHVIIDNVDKMELDITLYGDNILETQNLNKKIEQILGEGIGIRNLTIRGMNEYNG